MQINCGICSVLKPPSQGDGRLRREPRGVFPAAPIKRPSAAKWKFLGEPDHSILIASGTPPNRHIPQFHAGRSASISSTGRSNKGMSSGAQHSANGSLERLALMSGGICEPVHIEEPARCRGALLRPTPAPAVRPLRMRQQARLLPTLCQPRSVRWRLRHRRPSFQARRSLRLPECGVGSRECTKLR